MTVSRNDKEIDELVQKNGFPPLFATFLKKRGCKTTKDVKNLFSKDNPRLRTDIETCLPRKDVYDKSVRLWGPLSSKFLEKSRDITLSQERLSEEKQRINSMDSALSATSSLTARDSAALRPASNLLRRQNININSLQERATSPDKLMKVEQHYPLVSVTGNSTSFHREQHHEKDPTHSTRFRNETFVLKTEEPPRQKPRPSSAPHCRPNKINNATPGDVNNTPFSISKQFRNFSFNQPTLGPSLQSSHEITDGEKTNKNYSWYNMWQGISRTVGDLSICVPSVTTQSSSKYFDQTPVVQKEADQMHEEQSTFHQKSYEFHSTDDTEEIATKQNAVSFAKEKATNQIEPLPISKSREERCGTDSSKSQSQDRLRSSSTPRHRVTKPIELKKRFTDDMLCLSKATEPKVSNVHERNNDHEKYKDIFDSELMDYFQKYRIHDNPLILEKFRSANIFTLEELLRCSKSQYEEIVLNLPLIPAERVRTFFHHDKSGIIERQKKIPQPKQEAEKSISPSDVKETIKSFSHQSNLMLTATENGKEKVEESVQPAKISLVDFKFSEEFRSFLQECNFSDEVLEILVRHAIADVNSLLDLSSDQVESLKKQMPLLPARKFGNLYHRLKDRTRDSPFEAILDGYLTSVFDVLKDLKKDKLLQEYQYAKEDLDNCTKLIYDSKDLIKVRKRLERSRYYHHTIMEKILELFQRPEYAGSLNFKTILSQHKEKQIQKAHHQKYTKKVDFDLQAQEKRPGTVYREKKEVSSSFDTFAAVSSYVGSVLSTSESQTNNSIESRSDATSQVRSLSDGYKSTQIF